VGRRTDLPAQMDIATPRLCPHARHRWGRGGTLRLGRRPAPRPRPPPPPAQAVAPPVALALRPHLPGQSPHPSLSLKGALPHGRGVSDIYALGVLDVKAGVGEWGRRPHPLARVPSSRWPEPALATELTCRAFDAAFGDEPGRCPPPLPPLGRRVILFLLLDGSDTQILRGSITPHSRTNLFPNLFNP